LGLHQRNGCHAPFFAAFAARLSACFLLLLFPRAGFFVRQGATPRPVRDTVNFEAAKCPHPQRAAWRFEPHEPIRGRALYPPGPRRTSSAWRDPIHREPPGPPPDCATSDGSNYGPRHGDARNGGRTPRRAPNLASYEAWWSWPSQRAVKRRRRRRGSLCNRPSHAQQCRLSTPARPGSLRASAGCPKAACRPARSFAPPPASVIHPNPLTTGSAGRENIVRRCAASWRAFASSSAWPAAPGPAKRRLSRRNARCAKVSKRRMPPCGAPPGVPGAQLRVELHSHCATRESTARSSASAVVAFGSVARAMCASSCASIHSGSALSAASTTIAVLPV
jgi:hypothetical protein